MNTPALQLRVRCIDDLIAVAPVVLGYHPREAVVMISAEGIHVFHCAAPLPARADPPGSAEAVADQMVDPARRNGIRRAVFVFFSGDERRVRPVWAAVRRGCQRAGIEVSEVVRVDGRRYYPLRGQPHLREAGIAYDVSAHPFFAAAVLHGYVIEKDRDALVARVAPDPVAQAAVEGALEDEGLAVLGPPRTGAERRRWGEWLRAVVVRHVTARTIATDDEAARIGWAAQDVRVRDAAWALIERERSEQHRAFWLDLTRRMPDRLAAAPAALLGWSAWQSGNGALAWIAVDRCEAVAPDYRMAQILAGLLARAVPPDTVSGHLAWDEGLPA